MYRNINVIPLIFRISLLIVLIPCGFLQAQTIYDAPAADTSCQGYKIKGDKVYFWDELIPGADVKSFICIANEYSKDKNHVYFGTKIFKPADPKSFVALEWGFAKDKNHVYYNYYSGKIIKGADPETFVVFDLPVCKDKNKVYVRDKKDNFIEQKGADAKTFKGAESYYCDKNFLYNVYGNILARRDTFDIERFLKPPLTEKDAQ